VLFEGAEAHIGQRSRIALIGPNGAGKSTLIRMILEQESPDAGRIGRAQNLNIGHLAQEVPKLSGRTVIGEAMRMDGRREGLVKTKQAFEEKFASGDTPEADLERYGRILEELEHLDEYRLESRAKEILTGMGFKPSDYDRPLDQFSGGWLMRVALSRVLLMEPDLLLLDEPTNHLDLESLLWLEEFLQAYRGALLLVSHDTAFLNRMVHEVMEIDQKRLWVYRGNLDAFVLQKEERLTLLRSQRAGQDAKIADLEDFIRRFGAKAAKQLEKIKDELVELPEHRESIRFKFPAAPHSGREVVTAKKAELKFGADKTVFKGLDWVIQRGSRVAIVGINGAGKTTLLRMVSGDLSPTQGEIKHGHEVKVGYYAQHQAETLNMQKTVLEELWDTAPHMEMARIRGVAGAFLFSGDAVDKKCGVLSGGEKARVALAKLLLQPSNFLLLDEPTNHLDVESRGMLLQALQNYEGTLCLVSHDREFVAPLVTSVLEISPQPGGSQVIPLVGSYDDYVAKKLKEAAQAAALSRAPEEAKAAKAAAQATEPARTGPSNNQKRSWEREREKTEAEITKLEKRQAELHTQLADQATYEDKALVLKLSEEQRQIAEQLSAKLSRWEELCSLLG
jgi:ATP-binding cassette subfamily F protein 3